MGCRHTKQYITALEVPEGLKYLTSEDFFRRTFLNAFDFHLAQGLDVPAPVLRLILTDVVYDASFREDGTRRAQDHDVEVEFLKWRQYFYDQLKAKYPEFVDEWERFRASPEYEAWMRKLHEIPNGKARREAAFYYAMAYVYGRYQKAPSQLAELHADFKSYRIWRIGEFAEEAWCKVWSRKWVWWLSFMLTIDWGKLYAATTGEVAFEGDKLPWYAKKWVDPKTRKLAFIYEETIVPILSELASTAIAEAARRATMFALICLAQALLIVASFHPALAPLAWAARIVQITNLIAVASPFAFFGWQLALEWPMDMVVQTFLRPLLSDIYIGLKLKQWGKTEWLKAWGSVPDRALNRLAEAMTAVVNGKAVQEIIDSLPSWIDSLEKGFRWAAWAVFHGLDALVNFLDSVARFLAHVPGFMRDTLGRLWHLLRYGPGTLKRVHESETGKHRLERWAREYVKRHELAAEFVATLNGVLQVPLFKKVLSPLIDITGEVLGFCNSSTLASLVEERVQTNKFLPALGFSHPQVNLRADFKNRSMGAVFHGARRGAGSRERIPPFPQTLDAESILDHAVGDVLDEYPNLSPDGVSASSSPYKNMLAEFYGILGGVSFNIEIEVDRIEEVRDEFSRVMPGYYPNPFDALRILEIAFADKKVTEISSTNNVCYVPVMASPIYAPYDFAKELTRVKHTSEYSSAMRLAPTRKVAVIWPEYMLSGDYLALRVYFYHRSGIMTHQAVSAIIYGGGMFGDKHRLLGYLNNSRIDLYSGMLEVRVSVKGLTPPRLKMSSALSFISAKIAGSSNESLSRNWSIRDIWYNAYDPVIYGFFYDPRTGLQLLGCKVALYSHPGLNLIFNASERYRIKTPSYRTKVVRSSEVYA